MHVLVYVNWGSMALFGIYLENAMPMIEYLWTCFGSDLSHFMWLSGKLWILLITVTGPLLVWVVQQVPVSLLSHAMSYLVCHIPISVLQYWWMMVYSSLVYSNTYIFWCVLTNHYSNPAEAEAFFKIWGGSGSGREAKTLCFHITAFYTLLWHLAGYASISFIPSSEGCMVAIFSCLWERISSRIAWFSHWTGQYSITDLVD